MKRHLLLFAMLFVLCLPLGAQINSTEPLAQKVVLAELNQDLRDFNKKVANTKITKRNKATLASEYSDLVDRMDAICHNPIPTQKVNNRVIAAKKITPNRINH